MRFQNVQNWTNLEGMRGLLFFVQRLQELTFPYSLDSYKSPTTSIQGLIYEAISLLNDAHVFGKDSQEKALNSVENIVQEIRARIKGNWVAGHVCSLDIGKLLTENLEKMKIDEMIRQLGILRAELDSEAYIAEIVNNIILLASGDRNKVKLDFLAREFTAFIQNKGVSRDHINRSLVEFFFRDRPIEDEEDFREYCQVVYPHMHNFVVIVGVSNIVNSIDEEVLASRRMIIVGSEFIAMPKEELNEFRQEAGFETLLAIETSATDYHSAVSNALSQLESIHSFYRIFNHKDSIKTSSIALTEQGCCEGVRKTIELPRNNMHFIRDMRRVKATSTLRRFDKYITLDLGRDAIKLNNIMNIHGMSLDSKSEDIQLVNLWTCLETLAPGHTGASKISNVVNRVVPVLMLGYYNRIIVNLLFDVLRWDRRSLTLALRSSATTSQHNDLKANFIALLADSANTNALSDLYARCRDFELLRFRLHSISELLKDPKKTSEKLSMHENMVRWQIHRIYRTRNRIVHAGESPTFTKYLVENAHDFFDQTFLFCLELSSWKAGFDTFLKCFDYAEIQYNSYKSAIKTYDPQEIAWVLPKNKDRSFIFPEYQTS